MNKREYITAEELKEHVLSEIETQLDRKIKYMNEGEYIGGIEFKIPDFGFSDSATIKKYFTKASREFMDSIGPIVPIQEETECMECEYD